MVIANCWKPLNIITKSSTWDVAAALDPPPDVVYCLKERRIQNPVKRIYSQVWNRRPPSHTSLFLKNANQAIPPIAYSLLAVFFFDPPFLNTT